MRLDKFLKVSRLIKRRTVANEACDAGRVAVNGKPAKASVSVKEGDVIEIQFGNKSVKAEVLKIQETTKKEEAKDESSKVEQNEEWKCDCGNVNKGKFCSNCGKPKSNKKKCTKCGAENEATDKFCSECGTKLE